MPSNKKEILWAATHSGVQTAAAGNNIQYHDRTIVLAPTIVVFFFDQYENSILGSCNGLHSYQPTSCGFQGSVFLEWTIMGKWCQILFSFSSDKHRRTDSRILLLSFSELKEKSIWLGRVPTRANFRFGEMMCFPAFVCMFSQFYSICITVNWPLVQKWHLEVSFCFRLFLFWPWWELHSPPSLAYAA